MAYNLDDATPDFFDLGDNLDTSPDFTICATIKPDDTATRHMIASKWQVTGGNRAWLFEVNSDATLRAFVSTDGTFQAGNVVSSTGTISTSARTHVALVQDGTNTDMTLYINGSQDDQNASGPATVFNTGTARFLIGAQDDVTTTLEMDGDMEEVAFFQSALSAEDIASIAVSGYTPEHFLSSSLAMYAPLVRVVSDDVGGFTITTNGTPSVVSHSSVIERTGPLIGHNAAAVASGRIMSSLAAAGGLAGPGGIAGQGGGLAG